MTQFAIFFEMSDAAAIAGTIQAASLPNSLKQRGRPFWNGGLRDWAAAPLGHHPNDIACPLCHVIVINAGNNDDLAGFRQLIYDIAAFLGTEDGFYCRVLADNMVPEMSGAMEPYP